MDIDKDTYDIGLSNAQAVELSADFYLVQVGDRERWDVYLTETDDLIGSSETLRKVRLVVEDWIDKQKISRETPDIVGHCTGGTVAPITGIVTVEEIDVLDAIVRLDEINGQKDDAK